jgi:hypothetical protein
VLAQLFIMIVSVIVYACLAVFIDCWWNCGSVK